MYTYNDVFWANYKNTVMRSLGKNAKKLMLPSVKKRICVKTGRIPY